MTTPRPLPLPPGDAIPLPPDSPPPPDYYAALNPRQQRFARLVAEGMSQAQAYIHAGYDAAHPGNVASDLVRDNPCVQAAIAQQQAVISARAAISQERIAEELMAVGLLKVDDILARGAKGILRITDKLKALELLGKWKRMFEHEQGQGTQFILIIQPPPGADQPMSVGQEIPLAPGVTLQVPPDATR